MLHERHVMVIGDSQGGQLLVAARRDQRFSVRTALVIRDGVRAAPILVAWRVDLKVTLIKMRAAIQRRPPC